MPVTDIVVNPMSNRIASASPSSTTWSAIRNASSAPMTSPFGSNNVAMQSRELFGSYRIVRTFVCFDLSSLSIDSINNLTLKYRSGTSTSNTSYRIVKSTAFGGDGSSNISNSDWNNWSTTTYASLSPPTANFNINIGLPAAVSDAETDGYLNIAFMSINDFANSPPSSNSNNANYINFSNSFTFTLTVDYVELTSNLNISGVEATKMSDVNYNSVSGV